ncbi:MAG: glycosyltransferase family 4 protein [Planctomycetota bacterium]
MRALIFSSDRQIFDPDGDSFNRMAAYGRLLESLTVLVTCDRTESNSAGNVTLVPTGGSSRIARFCRSIRIGKSLARKEKFDLVVVQDPLFGGFAGWRVARAARARLLVSVYGTNVFDPHWVRLAWKNRLLKRLASFILNRSDAIQTDGFETEADLRKRYGDRVFWKPIVPENIEEYRSIPRKTTPGEFKVLFIARMLPQKNIRFLVDVMDRLGKKGLPKKISFTVVGDGPDKKFLDAEVARRGLSACVRLVPGCTRQELPGLYTTHDAFVLTSHFEGFPRVFMEAAASGLPIVTTRVSGVTNVLENGASGFVSEQGDLDGFVANLARLAGDDALAGAFSEKIRADFWKRYSFAVTIERQKAIFDYLERAR